MSLQGWPAGASNGQTATNGAAGMYGTVSGAQQTGYGTGQEAFAQSTGYPSPAGAAAYGAFGQQQTGYGGAQVCQQGKQTCCACNAAPSAPEMYHVKWSRWSPALQGVAASMPCNVSCMFNPCQQAAFWYLAGRSSLCAVHMLLSIPLPGFCHVQLL